MKSDVINTDGINTTEKSIAPSILEIYETSINYEVYTVFGDGLNNRIIEILKGNDKDTVTNFLKSLCEIDKVKYAIMDFNDNYKIAINEVLNNTCIVIDKKFVINKLQEAFGKVIKSISNKIQKQEDICISSNNVTLMLKSSDTLSSREYRKLNEFLLIHSDFINPYILKEALISIYDSKNIKEAKQLLEEWIKECNVLGISEYDTLIKTISNRDKDILNYFSFNHC